MRSMLGERPSRRRKRSDKETPSEEKLTATRSADASAYFEGKVRGLSDEEYLPADSIGVIDSAKARQHVETWKA